VYKAQTEYRIVIYNFPIEKKYIKQYSKERMIPNFVFGLDKKSKWAVIEGLLGSDGYLYLKSN